MIFIQEVFRQNISGSVHRQEKKIWGKKVAELTLNQAYDNLCPSSVFDITSPDQNMGSQLDSTYLYWGEPVPQMTTTEILQMMPSS